MKRFALLATLAVLAIHQAPALADPIRTSVTWGELFNGKADLQYRRWRVGNEASVAVPVSTADSSANVIAATPPARISAPVPTAPGLVLGSFDKTPPTETRSEPPVAPQPRPEPAPVQTVMAVPTVEAPTTPSPVAPAPWDGPVGRSMVMGGFSPAAAPAPPPAPVNVATIERTPELSTRTVIAATPVPQTQFNIPSLSTSASATPAYDARIDFGTGPFADASSLTNGSPGAWYNSPVVQRLYGGTPNDQQRAEFTENVLKVVQDTYHRSGLSVAVTTDPTASAAHTQSVVSGTGNPSNPDAIGMANIGGNGFSYLDKFDVISSITDLETALGKNIAHELMHTFGAGHHDTTGNFLDSAVSPWSALTNPDTVFSPAAVQELASLDFRNTNQSLDLLFNAQHAGHAHTATCSCARTARMAAQVVAQPVPEPSTILLWAGLGLAGATYSVRNRRRRAA